MQIKYFNKINHDISDLFAQFDERVVIVFGVEKGISQRN